MGPPGAHFFVQWSRMYWTKDVSELLQEFSTDPLHGLSQHAVQKSLQTYGLNTLVGDKRITQLELFLKQFNNTMSYLLALAAIISLALNETIDAVAILSIVILNGFVGYIQESKAEASIAALKELSTPKAKVIREGKVITIDSSQIVPGDILTLEAGDYVVADAIIINSFQLSVNEAVLTGESMPVEKKPGVLPEQTPLAERQNSIHASTAISAGSARALVVSTGMNTEIGKIANLLKTTKSEETPLQKRLNKVSNKLLFLGLIVMFLVTGLGIYQGKDWVSIFLLSISLAVAAIPEGLPTIVTLALALAVRRMSHRNAIVRKMAAVESLGSTDVICTDKTGTLTTGDMSVREIYSSWEEDLKRAAVCCNNASLDNGGTGDPTEIALLQMAVGISPYERVYEWSFDSNRKRMSVAVRNSDEEIIIYSKGAPESMLTKCNLSSEERESINSVVLNYSSKGRRTLALATKKILSMSKTAPPSAEDIENELQFLGIVALADPPKPETITSIAACKVSGIRIIMITGDHPLTAEAIARELGIVGIHEQQVVMTGQELETITPEELKVRCEQILVYARVSPEQKLKIVEALQAHGHTVAMTGDGVNDAPALKKASIGIAMGKAGTEVARQASTMILTDDNFSTIVHAVEEGRAIFGNIKRTIQYLLSTNLAEILIVLGAAIMGLPLPFVPISLLWINLVTDGFPSLALAAEPVEKGLLETHSHPSPKNFFSQGFMRELFLVAIIMSILELSIYYYMLQRTDVHIAKSYAFNLLVYMSLFRSFSCRSEVRTYWQLPVNYYHIGAVTVPILLQIILENTSFFQTLMDISSITIMEHLVLMFLAIIPVTIIECKKIKLIADN